jgi:hypothetical protein
VNRRHQLAADLVTTGNPNMTLSLHELLICETQIMSLAVFRAMASAEIPSAHARLLSRIGDSDVSITPRVSYLVTLATMCKVTVYGGNRTVPAAA